MTPYKGRGASVGQHVFCYRNLNAQKRDGSVVYSIRGARFVLAHAGALRLSGVKFRVSETGRQQVLRERRKNVHAVVSGSVESFDGSDLEDMVAVSYNPYQNSTFVVVETGEPILEASEVVLNSKGAFAKL